MVYVVWLESSGDPDHDTESEEESVRKEPRMDTWSHRKKFLNVPEEEVEEEADKEWRRCPKPGLSN